MISCWGIAETAGMTSQVRALALALGATLDMKTLPISKPWDLLPNIAYATPLGGVIFKRFIAHGVDVNPPYPDLVISCGRRASMAALGLKNIIRNDKTKFTHIHHPCVPAKCFDLVVTVDHDNLNGANVIKTRFALHSVTPATLAEASQRFAPRFAGYPAPHVAVLLGGTTNHYDFTAEAMAQIVMALQRLLGATPGSLLITPSRRTGEANVAMLRQVFAGNPRVYIYIPPPIGGRLGGGHSCSVDKLLASEQASPHPNPPPRGEGIIEENPYMGMLALAETIVVTNDSVNMMSEACATGKPVYILPLPGHSGTKQARFAEGLIHDGIARPLAGKLESWQYDIGNEMEKLAAEIKRRLDL